MKYTHPSTAAVAHVTVATDSYDSELPPGSPERYGRSGPGFTSSIEYGGDGSPLRSSLRNSSLSSPEEGSWSRSRSPSGSPRVTFEGDVPIRVSEQRSSSFDGQLQPSVGDGSPADARASGQRGSSTAPDDISAAQQQSRTSSVRPSRTSSVRPSAAETAAKSVSKAEPENTDAVGPGRSTAVDPATRQSMADAGLAAKTDATEPRPSTGPRPSAGTSMANAGRASQAAEASTEAGGPQTAEPKKPSVRPSTSDVGVRASNAAAEPANASKNNPQANVNRNATEAQKTGNVFVRLYRKLFMKRRDQPNDDETGASRTPMNNTNVNNIVDEGPRTSAGIPPSTRSVGAPKNPTPTLSSGARAAVPSAVWNNDQFVDNDDFDDDSDYDDDEDDVTTTAESNDDTNNEYTRLIRRRRQPLPDLSQLCRTSFTGRTTTGDSRSRMSACDHRKSTYDRKSSAGRRYDALGETSSD